MSLVWTIIATFLYVEIAVVLLLVLPIASPQRWNRFFKSQFLAMISRQANIYFVLLFGILVLFLLEAIREMRKYSHHENTTSEHLNVELQHSMRLFRAQRNFYISGFSIFLTLVIRRLVILISSQAQLLAQSEASMRQAQSATSAARSLLSQQKTDDKSTDTKKGDSKPDELIGELKQKIADLNKELEHERKDKEALKSQATGLEKEYDRLTEEYSKLERRVTVSGGGKDD
ncbi:B-cell receptor-associated protein 31 isoform X2 [Contarinia nasturtii]|uniref:B-cell receptor-associated protein 31 isoform X2 n=1 Tax=Contarinia nasturtii TaxID=265458 RepID=UPI0012D387D0|nr:B-cell receptor-associated protein 31 isoform X2 [Contarinia nasturtii]